jgi:hypothetical protein
VHHLRSDPVAPDPAGRLEILQQLAEKVLPALR